VKTWLLKYWDRLRSSFWFIPSLMACGAIALSFITVALDKTVTERWLQAHTWAYTGGAEGASLVLSTVAASMITIAGVVFSMTLVALSLASSQLGPRLLRNFMRDTANQVVLGTFVDQLLEARLKLEREFGPFTRIDRTPPPADHSQDLLTAEDEETIVRARFPEVAR